jgi:hypothetical protein
VASHACVACAAGSTNASGDDATGSDTICDATLCSANQRVSSHACVACAAGSTNASGDDATGSDTACDATLCAANERVVSNACVACPAGSTNAAGDNATGSNTTCDATLCAANQYVSNHACVACGVATTNDAGDDASGSDTICDPVLCEGNEYVSSHVCVACDPGFGRDAGDPASGSDTTCTETYTLFVSSTTHSGNLGGLAGADLICQGLADDASLSGTYVALISTSAVDAIDRISNTSYTIRLVDGTRVADDRADFFDNSAIAAPDKTETGAVASRIGSDPSDPISVMTGSNADGTFFFNLSCSDWTSTSGGPTVGFADWSSAFFGNIGTRGCNLSSTEHIYCIGR